jgi:hypothetical protein
LAGDKTVSPAATWAPVAEGSTTTTRAETDLDSGEVYIYVGGAFPALTHPVAFRYLFDFTESGNTSGYITPLLFEYSLVNGYAVYTVAGIGQGFRVDVNSAPGTIPFTVLEGTAVPPNANFTFGYVNAIVNSSGTPLVTSTGTVDFDIPADSGEGVGGSGTTNEWRVTAVSPSPVVAIGTTFGPTGSGADYTFFPQSRTYSAQALGKVAVQ